MRIRGALPLWYKMCIRDSVEVKRIVIRQVMFFKTTVGEVAADRADNGTDRNGDDHAKDTPEAASDQNRDDDCLLYTSGRNGLSDFLIPLTSLG